MNLSLLIELAIAIVLIFFLFSTVATGLVEYFFNHLFFLRNKSLSEKLSQVLYGLKDEIYNHPSIINYWKDIKHRILFIWDSKSPGPVYISSKVFTAALIDHIIQKETSGATDSFEKFKNGLSEDLWGDDENPPSENEKKNVQDLLKSFVSNSTNLETLKEQIESWYDAYMDRVSGTFKKKSKQRLFWTSLILSLLFNINTFSILFYYTDSPDELKKSLKIAESIAAKSSSFDPSNDTLYTGIIRSVTLLDQSQMPVLWKNWKETKILINAERLLNIDTLKLKAETEKSKYWSQAAKYSECVKDKNAKKEYDRIKCECEKAILNKDVKGIKKNCGEVCLQLTDQIKKERKKYRKELEKEFEFKTWFQSNYYAFIDNVPLFILGFFLTAFAGARGATFWFDTLNRFVNARSTGIKPLSKK